MRWPVNFLTLRQSSFSVQYLFFGSGTTSHYFKSSVRALYKSYLSNGFFFMSESPIHFIKSYINVKKLCKHQGGLNKEI